MSLAGAEYGFRILAVDPTRRGFGYVVLEAPERLMDWGVVRVAPERKNAACLDRIRELVALYSPDAIAIEDVFARGSRRRRRVRALFRRILLLGRVWKVGVVQTSWRTVREHFRDAGSATKHEIAQSIAGRFPELASRLPPRRRPWMSADERMSLFDSAAVAFVVLGGSS